LEKAKELLQRFHTEISEVTVINNVAERRVLKMSKQCALICVDEILKTSASEYEHEDNFWREVKRQIELL